MTISFSSSYNRVYVIHKHEVKVTASLKPTPRMANTIESQFMPNFLTSCKTEFGANFGAKLEICAPTISSVRNLQLPVEILLK